MAALLRSLRHGSIGCNLCGQEHEPFWDIIQLVALSQITISWLKGRRARAVDSGSLSLSKLALNVEKIARRTRQTIGSLARSLPCRRLTNSPFKSLCMFWIEYILREYGRIWKSICQVWEEYCYFHHITWLHLIIFRAILNIPSRS